MIKYFFLTTILANLVCLPLHAQPYDLRPRYIQGQLTTHRETSTIQVASDYFPGNIINYRIESEFTQLVKKVYPDGAVDLEITYLASKTVGTDRAPQKMDYSYLVGIPLLVKMNRDYRVLKVEPGKELSEEAKADFQRFKQYFYNFAPDAYIPDRLVTIGESWENQQAFSYEMMGSVFDQVDKTQSTLKEETTFENRQSLNIDFEGEFNGTISENMMGEVSGKYSGKRTIEKETGQDLHLQMTIDQTMESTTEQGDIKFNVKVLIERQLTSETSISVR